MDGFDLSILKALQKDGTASLEQIGNKIGLSPPACHRRIKRLEEQGIITGRGVLIDKRKVGIEITAFFSVELHDDSADIDSVMERFVRENPEVVGCYLVSGNMDFLLITKFKSAIEYTDYIYHFLDYYHDIPIKTYRSTLVVRTLKQTHELPI
ncbi:Lrp/AsnC family transcriptional regulator [Vibrio sp. CAU 1672]|uniref:Lrp/AsnC family transcriptional regulator n=1 Tax=Vibrio sp. CAU 1672 TaxID=3032594 RepID=UPI0023DA92BE|nr:Lrp/AsnC family transcriptional regulator [Vibrio sp. CAU 1672]MDF2153833.1 Lrp/AsnC family transcriptional regulator [Vibrio sp. CAU 1672]